MIGRGKGALRIAIEDFFETTPVGKWFANWWEDFSDSLEIKFIDPYRDIFKDIYDATGLKIFGEVASAKTPPKGRMAWLPIVIGAAVALVGAVSMAFVAPVAKLADYASSRVAKQARLSPGDVIDALFRDLPGAEAYKKDLYDLGWSDERITMLQQISRRMLGVQDHIMLWLRGHISDDELRKRLGKLGYDPHAIGDLIALSPVIPGVNDLIMMAVREAWNEDIVQRFRYDEDFPPEVADWAAKQGLSKDWAKRYWRAHWTLPSPSMGYEMLHRLRPGRSKNPFTVSDMQGLLKTADYPTFFRERLIDISYAPYTRVDIRRMYKLGILSADEVYECYKDIGYDDDHAKNLAEFTIRYETGDEDTKPEKYKTLSLNLLKQAYMQDIINLDTLRSSLQDMGYPDEEQATILALYDFERLIKSTPEVRSELKNNTRKVTETAYSLGLIDRATAMGYLATVGWTEGDSDSLLNLIDYTNELSLTNEQLGYLEKMFVQRILDEQDVVIQLNAIGIPTRYQEYLLQRWYMRREVKQRNLTEAQYRTAWIRGVITEDEYRENLRGLGYTDYDINILTSVYRPA